MTTVNRRWLLARRPTGTATVDDMHYEETEIPDASSLAPGHILVRTDVFLHAPTMRNWMDAPGNNYYPSVDIGAPMLATCGGEIIGSSHPRFPVGTRVTTIGAWEDYTVINADVMPVRPVADDLTMVEAMGPVGMNALTAYMGVIKIAQPQPGETMVVSGAAGSTGSVAGQIGRILGLRVIGIAGGPHKCQRLVDELGFSDAIDYRTENVEERLRELVPSGIDVFFDNVGGEILQAAVENMAKFGRIVLCGQIAGYNDSVPVPGPRNMMRLIYGSVRLQGYLLGDFEVEIPAARDQLLAWIRAGEMRHREHLESGFENLPATFGKLFDGSHDGTLMVVTDDSALRSR